MFDFLKKLYERRFKDITVILLDDSRPGEDNSFALRPNKLFVIIGVLCLIMAIVVNLFFMITPLGSLVYTKEDSELRKQVENITYRVIGLQDSLSVRENQLNEMKKVIRLSLDTTLTMDDRFSSLFELEDEPGDLINATLNTARTSERIGSTGIGFSNILKSAPDFPTSFPVQGTLTRDYEPNSFHYGIDIATKKDELVTAIADGTVVNASWTISDGYVISIQHAGGILSVYKHCSSLVKKSGDIILKGDIIGATGDVGITSSGPHLHFEIWKNGLSQDPAMYLIQ